MNSRKIIVISVIVLTVICIVIAIMGVVHKKEDDIDVYINTNYFITKIEKILNEEDNYNNKKVNNKK